MRLSGGEKKLLALVGGAQQPQTYGLCQGHFSGDLDASLLGEFDSL